MNCSNYAHSIEEVERLRVSAEGENGHVPGSFRAFDCGDGLIACSWRWEAVSPPGPKHPVDVWAEGELQRQVLRRTLAQLDPYSGLRAALARRDRTRGWMA